MIYLVIEANKNQLCCFSLILLIVHTPFLNERALFSDLKKEKEKSGVGGGGGCPSIKMSNQMQCYQQYVI